jgi:hypothetical protein
MNAPRDGFTVQPESLRAEGSLWALQSPKMGEISREGHFLRFNAEEGGLLSFMFVPSYHKAVTMIVDRCSEAEDRMNEIKDKLNELAAAYEAVEEQTMSGLRRATQPAR